MCTLLNTANAIVHFLSLFEIAWTYSEIPLMEEKLIELETKFSYQEDLLSELNRIVVVQQGQINNLLREIGAIKDQLQEAIERDRDGRILPQDEKPPHY